MVIRFSVNIIFPSLITALYLAVVTHVFTTTHSVPIAICLLSNVFPLIPKTKVFCATCCLFAGSETLSASGNVRAFRITNTVILNVVFKFNVPRDLFGLLGPGGG